MRWRLSICLLFALCRAAGAHAQASPAAPASPRKTDAKPEAKAQDKSDKKPEPIAPAASAPAQAGETPSAPPEKQGQASEPAPAAAAEVAPAEAPAQQSAEPSDASATGEAVPPGQAPAALPAPAAPSGDVPSPGEMENMLSQQLAASPQPNADWTAPAPILTLHGYFRVRGELLDNFWLGRRQLDDYKNDSSISTDNKAGQGSDPFSRFRPIERRVLPSASQGVSSRAPSDLNCVGESTKSDGTCDVSTLRFANMRLRLAPQLNLSEDIRVKMSFDVFDNLVLGEAPGSYYGTGLGATDVFPSTVNPTDGTGLGNTIKARRVWAEVRNRDLGELRFGRMPMSWGMGMYYNAGDKLDDDLSTDMDRVMGITKLAGLYFSASYDFTGEGFLDTTGTDNRPIDQSQLDDVGQFTFSVARRNSPEELTAAKERGDLVLNGGVQLSLRNQESIYNPPNPMTANADKMSPLQRVNATTRTTDLWGLFRYRNLRIEGEFAWVNGGMDRLADRTATATTAPATGSYSINQLGYALQGELRLLNEKLGLYLDHGLATGDSDVDGLSSDTDFISQQGTNRTISTFRFHPSYHVDLILWRTIMRQVTGAYYFRPGVSYDFIRSPFGQLAGARLDFIWSRASSFLQTWGNDPNLGIEIDASLYFRSEDGPDLDDGFHAMVQYGVLFPMRGLSYLHEDTNLSTAQTLRLVLGVVF